jgi:hypothetical protein
VPTILYWSGLWEADLVGAYEPANTTVRKSAVRAEIIDSVETVYAFLATNSGLKILDVVLQSHWSERLHQYCLFCFKG